MQVLDKSFPPLNDGMIARICAGLLGRLPRPDELEWLKKNANDSWLVNGVMGFSQPWYDGRPLMLVYSCCHAAQLLTYWFAFSTSYYIFNHYNVVYLSNYRSMQDAHYGAPPGEKRDLASLPASYSEIFTALWRRADLIIHHPAYGDTEFSPGHLLEKFKDNSFQRISFHSPSFGALWPLCIFGDDWAKNELRRGVSADDLIAQLDKGTANCHLQERWAAAFERMQRKDRQVDIEIADFFEKHWREHRMFITVNHPSFTLMASQAMKIEAALLHRLRPGSVQLNKGQEDFLLQLPYNACNFQPVWPDHYLTAKELPTNYREHVGDTNHFYADEVRRCAKEVSTSSPKRAYAPHNEP